MAVFIIRRLLWLPFVILFISVVTFYLGLIAPGNPVQVMMGLHANPATIERLNQEYGFDQPFYVQYIRYVSNALQGDLGYGLVKYRDQPVSRLIAETLPVTVELNIVALVFGIVVGVPLGLIIGLVKNPMLDGVVRFVMTLLVAVPVIFLNPILAFIFSTRHDFLIPLVNFTLTIGPILPFVGGHWDGIFSTKTVLPALIESLGVIFGMMRFLRAGVIEELNKDYVRTARAKGLRERFVITHHAMRNALLPIATNIGFALGGLVIGSFIVESFFGIPGIGALGFDALISREYYIIMAVTILVAISYVVANLFADLSYHFVDPRIRIGDS